MKRFLHLCRGFIGMKNWFFLLWIFFGFSLLAQTPSSCFEIESILVDPCGNPEYDNELVRFKVGPNDLNTSALNVNWPNNPFLGICQNAITAAAVASLNATLSSCAYILEPVGGVLPAGRTVYLVCGTGMNPSANQFGNLLDTVYMIFQCPGNNAGHFKNYQAGAGSRTLVIDFGVGCQDVVTYLVDSLVTTAGVPGLQDGSYVDFTWSGTDTYQNDGCAIPAPLPAASIFANLPTACIGDSLRLRVETNSTEPASYVWTSNCGNFTTTINDTTALYINTLGSSSFVSVTVTLLCSGTQLVDTLWITPSTSPQAAVAPAGNTVLCPGDAIPFTASGGVTYTWSTGAAGNTLTVGPAGVYFLVASDNCALDTAYFSISNPLPASAGIAASQPALCPGGSLDLYASGNGNFLWSTGATTDTITVFSSGLISLSADNGCVIATDVINIVNGVLPSATINPANLSPICPGDSALLTGVFSSGQILWLPIGDTVNTAIYGYPGNTIQLVNTNFCGSDTASVFIPAAPAVSALVQASATAICPGDSTLLTGSGGTGGFWIGLTPQNPVYVDAPGTYQYVAIGLCPSDTASITIAATPLPNLDLQVANAVSICAGSSLVLAPVSSAVPVWQDGSVSPTFTVTQPGLYYATVTASCGSSSDSVVVTVINAPTTTVSPNPVPYCAGSQNAVSVSGADSYEWYDGSTLTSWTVPSTGSYWVLGSNACGSDTAYFDAVPGSGPTAFINPAGPVPLCPGDTVTITAGGAANIVWQDGSSGTVYTATSAGTYFAIVSDACGSDTVEVMIIPGTEPVASISFNTLTFCEGESIILNAPADTGVNYYWSNGQTTPVIAVSEPGQYTLTAFNACGNVSSSVVASQENVDANAQATSTVLFPGQSVGVFLRGDNINQVQWTLPDGSQSSEFELSLRLDTVGVYTFTALVTSPAGCTTNTAVDVEVKDGVSFFAPAAFTPDGNGINERYRGYGTGIETYQMIIYDRWGRVVFSSDDEENGWDGYDKGRPCPTGQYAYEFLLRSTEGVEKSFYGFFILLR